MALAAMLSEEEKFAVMKMFEDECIDMSHKHCKCCRRVSLNLKVNQSGYCVGKCSTMKDKEAFIKSGALPIWKDGDKIMYSLPECLKGLTHAEKMLIQRISPLVALHHMKMGICGMTGHSCAFEQDITGFVDRLPRGMHDITMLRVMKTFMSEIGGAQDTTIKAFLVRKWKVLGALQFLKLHHDDYADINIDMSALDWMNGEEGIIDCHVLATEEILTTADDDGRIDDIGPAPGQAVEPRTVGDDVGVFGFIDEGGKTTLSPEDTVVNDILQEAVKASPRRSEMTVDWPSISKLPVSEFDDTRIFVNAFPWLFPGGVGDPKDFREGTLATWGEQMLHYEDGRFATDKIFGFYAMNHIIRMRNSTSGKWFVENFQKRVPNTLQDLKDQIAGGDTTFVNCLTYYNQRVKGSSPFWFKKKCELYAWINHHVEIGNGAPTFFITLSCAEFLWADVIAKVKERIDIGGGDSSDCYVGSPKLATIVNDYSIVIQEYFQKRVVAWLDTVGKQVFGIKHYWIRYEFAPGRGQIHAHLLAIPEDHSIYELCHLDLQQPNGAELRAARLADWAATTLGLTASVTEGFDELKIDRTNTPVRVRFKDISDSEETRNNDFQGLMNHVQVHACSGFCMRCAQGSDR